MSEQAQPQLSVWAYVRLVLLGAVVGIPAALLAVAFLVFVHDLEHWLWHDLPHHLDESSPPWYLVIGLPVAGACLVAIARRFLPGDGGHQPLHGFAGKPPLLSYAPGIALAAIGTLSFGAVLGPEGPLIALGAVVGIAITRIARLGGQESAILGNAGSFAAISALFGGPIVGGVLMMEGAIGFGQSRPHPRPMWDRSLEDARRSDRSATGRADRPLPPQTRQRRSALERARQKRAPDWPSIHTQPLADHANMYLRVALRLFCDNENRAAPQPVGVSRACRARASRRRRLPQWGRGASEYVGDLAEAFASWTPARD